MEKPSPKRRFRFGLRTLLLLVAVCAIAVGVYRTMPTTVTSDQLDPVLLGMPEEDVLRILGKPNSITVGRKRGDWHYDDPDDPYDHHYISFHESRISSVGYERKPGAPKKQYPAPTGKN